MSTKHTPGPWIWRNGFLTSLFQGKLDTATILENSEQVELIEANSRLISAAPEMLEALENALGAFNERECSCDFEDGPDGPRGRACYYHRIEQDIKEAIRKATGGPR